MKALTAEDLQSILDTEMVWRRKEISSLVALARSVSAGDQAALTRAVVPLLYAHWEGFGRECLIRYLEFVSFKRLKFKNLDPVFVYLASVPVFSGLANKNVKESLEILKKIQELSDEVNKNNFRKRINTKSNLRSDVLEELMNSCGLDFSVFNESIDFINKELCDSRNEIAHGSGASLSLESLVRRRDKTFELMTKLQTIVVNAAVEKKFRIAA